MTATVEFYFDYASPMAYLAHKRFEYFREQYDVDIQYRPMLLGGVQKATNNPPPIAVIPKGRYMLKHDLPRFVKRYQVPFNMNKHFPFSSLLLMRAAFAAQKMGIFEQYSDVAFDALWVKALKMGDNDIARQELLDNGLPADELFEMAQQPDIKQQLIDATNEAVERGCFGAPTMFVGDEMFFGQDRLDFIEEILQQG